MGVSTNISLPTKISHAGFRTKTVDFIQLNPVPPPPVMPASSLTLLAKRSHTLEPLAKAIGSTANSRRPSPDLSPQGMLRLGGRLQRTAPHADSRREMPADEKEGKQRSLR
ncbi:MAG: hypothetical protein WAL59_00955 [Roseiarcus sp.]